MSFLIIFCPGSLQVKSFTRAIMTFGIASTYSLIRSQSTLALIFTPHLQIYTPILIMVFVSDI
ncbi:MAG: hypothetical protein ACFE9Z_16930 [Promethearchaeota archaeon]